VAHTAPPSPTGDATLDVTRKARAHIMALRDGQESWAGLALWIEVTDGQPGTFDYDLYFETPAAAGSGDLVLDHDDLVVVVPEASIARLSGARLELSRDLLRPGLRIDNPNEAQAPTMASPDLAGSPGELTGDTATRITQVLERQINPSIAGHGGRADLVAVEDGAAYLRLSGGCQGCGMAAVTLGQGIETALLDAVPEITQVIDVTDHAAGSNPYYEAAKK
jgi:Fe/S biogenesis protein NfuA